MNKHPINLNTLAAKICEREGGEVNLSIAQVKEVLKITLDLLSEIPEGMVLELMEHLRKEKAKELLKEEE